MSETRFENKHPAKDVLMFGSPIEIANSVILVGDSLQRSHCLSNLLVLLEEKGVLSPQEFLAVLEVDKLYQVKD